MKHKGRPYPPVHLEKWHGEGETTACGLNAIDRELDILDEEAAEVYVQVNGEICKRCLGTVEGRATLSYYRSAIGADHDEEDEELP